MDGEIISTYGIYVDITDQMYDEEKMRESLHEKVVLLSEIHHCVKNNLAVITGLLELQVHNLENEAAEKALLDSQLCINLMALIHEMLYQNETLSNIGFDRYIRELSDVIQRSHSSKEREVNVRIEAEPIELPVTRAIPSGLLLNEIVTNAFKHAFNGKRNTENNIDISLKQLCEDRVKMVI